MSKTNDDTMMKFLASLSAALRAQWQVLAIGSLTLLFLYWISQANYLLFHTLAELYSIVIAVTIFVLTWNARHMLNNGYLLLLGMSFLAVSGLDLVHTLSFRGMTVLPGTAQGDPNPANLATQFWLAARYMQAAALVIAPFFVNRRVGPRVVLGGFLLVGALLAASIFMGVFPTSYVEGQGITIFKRFSEYVIILWYFIGLLALLKYRKAFDADVLRLLAFSVGFNIASEMAFTEYLNVSDFANLFGHFLKIISFYLIYKAIIETGFHKPQDLLYRELAQSEQALRASEARERAKLIQLEAIMDAVPAVVWIAHDSEARRVTGNRASAELLGLPPNANHSRHAPVVSERIKFYDENGNRLAGDQLPMHQAARSGQPVRDFQETVITGDGTERHLYGSVVPLFDEQNRPSGSVGAFIDITERVHAEEELQESEHRYRGLFERMGEGLSLHEILLDEDGQPVDYSIVEVNPAFERLTGLKREQVVGKTIRQLVPDVDPNWIGRYAQVAFSGQPLRFQDYSSLLDKYFEVLIYPTGPLQVAALSIDVTETVRSQSALRESEARMRRLVEANIIGITYAGSDGSLLMANQAFLDIIGYSQEELEAGQINWLEMTPPEYLPRDQQGIAEANERGACTPYEKEYIRKDGTRLPVLIGYAHFDNPQAPYIAFIINLSEQKRAESAARDYARRMEVLNRELARANRELQDFAFVASHDLQEPLRKIQAFGERLSARMKNQLDDETGDYLTRMINSSVRMRMMINDLLSLSRVTTRGKEFVNVDLREVANEVVSDLEFRLESSQGRVIIGDLPRIEADPIQMQQLLQNLIANALKFHKPDVPPEVRVYGSCTEDRTRAIIYVEDNGIGFDEQYVERIFQPFQRLHGMGQYEGSGIGLAVCRKIAERHGGSITARSTPGQGSMFIVNLPVQQAGKPK